MTDPVPSKDVFDLLPTRLRIKAARGGVIPIHDVTLTEAADEIERLQLLVQTFMDNKAATSLPRTAPEPPVCRCTPLADRPWKFCQDCGGLTQPPRDDHAG